MRLTDLMSSVWHCLRTLRRTAIACLCTVYTFFWLAWAALPTHICKVGGVQSGQGPVLDRSDRSGRL
jgi:hypothetical protein